MADKKSRRDFLKQAGAGVTVSSTLLSIPTYAQTTKIKNVLAPNRILGANDRINVASIGVGGRGTSVLRWAMDVGQKSQPAQIVAVCDVYRKRLNNAQQISKAEFATLDYREVIARKDVDAVIVATPDHWHAPISIDAMRAGKDVYCEKPMTKTVEEAKKFAEVAKATDRIVQIGSNTTSERSMVAGAQSNSGRDDRQTADEPGSYHRNSIEGEWNYKIDPNAGPDGKATISLIGTPGSARPRNARGAPNAFSVSANTGDYSSRYCDRPVLSRRRAASNICWGEAQFPYKVMASGGIYVFNDGREVPDTFHLIAEFPKGHSLVLSSSMANSQHIPGLLRGHEG
ncbi:MAG: Gfo/Idh/MocA family oxidoreductase [Blastocatellia bacterium]